MKDINSLNKVILIGRLGGKPELRYLPQREHPVARFTLATNERYLNPATNESGTRVEWHRIYVWGRLAEFCEKYLTPGKQIYLEGKLRTRTWQDREGRKRATTEIEAQNIILLGKKEEVSEKETYPEATSADLAALPEEDIVPPDEESGEEIPF